MKILVVGNWKMNPKTIEEAKRLFNLMRRKIGSVRDAEVVICPPFVHLLNFRFRLSSFKLGAQDCFWEQNGAYTGEVSPAMLQNLGCRYVLVGHSERRKYFGETNEMVNKKIKAALKAKLNPILCIGETKAERDRGQTESVLERQVVAALKNISSLRIGRILSIAYEPVWAIGTGRPCNPEEAQKMGLFIRKLISALYSRTVSESIRILYGGSVNSRNAGFYIREAGLQGLLIGGASLKPEEFAGIVKEVV